MRLLGERREPPFTDRHNEKREKTASPVVNDVHSRLNRTVQKEIVKPVSISDLSDLLKDSARKGTPVSIAGGRHAMGGQQFGGGTILFDMRNFNKIVRFCPEKGLVTVQSGINWLDLVHGLKELQKAAAPSFTIIQKPTGADDITIGGSLAANIHGRALMRPPFVADIESFQLIMFDGSIEEVSRTSNKELFSLAVGGYGLFGVAGNVTLRLTEKTSLKRTVEITNRRQLARKLEDSISDGCTYGDFQFAIDDRSEDFLDKGILSVYKPVTESSSSERRLSEDDWLELLRLAHHEKGEAFERYASHYMATSGQVYSSDDFQLSTYLPGYHQSKNGNEEEQRLKTSCPPGSEMISELYVPLDRLASFLARAKDALRRWRANVIYGTVRLIEEDNESFLPWANRRYACVIFNLHIDETQKSIKKAAFAFRALIQVALEEGGSYYLTYHRFAAKHQLLEAYPRLPQFLKLKERYDPQLRFQSNWYRYHKLMLG